MTGRWSRRCGRPYIRGQKASGEDGEAFHVHRLVADDARAYLTPSSPSGLAPYRQPHARLQPGRARLYADITNITTYTSDHGGLIRLP